MIVRRILFIVFLLGVWVQSAGACQEPLGLHEPEHALVPIPVSAATGEFADIGGDQRCECPASIQNVESAVSERGKSSLASIEADVGAVLHRAGPDPILLAVGVRAASFLARRAAQPLSLPVSRLRQ